MNELRPALKSDSVDEQRGGDRVASAIAADVELSDEHADEKASGDAAENENAMRNLLAR